MNGAERLKNRLSLANQIKDYSSLKVGFTGEKQGARVIEAFNNLFNTWKPREKYELINANEVKDRVINHKLLY